MIIFGDDYTNKRKQNSYIRQEAEFVSTHCDMHSEMY